MWSILVVHRDIADLKRSHVWSILVVHKDIADLKRSHMWSILVVHKDIADLKRSHLLYILVVHRDIADLKRSHLLYILVVPKSIVTPVLMSNKQGYLTRVACACCDLNIQRVMYCNGIQCNRVYLCIYPRACQANTDAYIVKVRVSIELLRMKSIATAERLVLKSSTYWWFCRCLKCFS